MVNMLLASGLQSGDLVGFTFFLGSVAMFAATVFLKQHQIIFLC